MSELGKTIKIYLPNGSPTGIRHAELTNWTGQAIVCPRTRIGELSQWDESRRPGVYFLFGVDDDDNPLAYIGEAENVFLRLQSHVKTKDFWDQVVFLTSKDDNLTKAHVKYLESSMIQAAMRSGRVALSNGTAPPLPSLPRSERDSMEGFLQPARTLLGALGFSILQPLPTRAESPGDEVSTSGALSEVRLYLRSPKRGADAEGARLDEGFIVYQDSLAAAAALPSLGPGYKILREELIADGTLAAEADKLRLTRDFLFKSPSAAASIFGGSAWGGLQAWKTKAGTTLKRLEEDLNASPGTAETLPSP